MEIALKEGYEYSFHLSNGEKMSGKYIKTVRTVPEDNSYYILERNPGGSCILVRTNLLKSSVLAIEQSFYSQLDLDKEKETETSHVRQ